MNHNVFWTPGMSLEILTEQIVVKAVAVYKGDRVVAARTLGLTVEDLESKLASVEAKAEASRVIIEDQRRKNTEQLLRSRFGKEAPMLHPDSPPAPHGLRPLFPVHVEAHPTVRAPKPRGRK